MKRNKLILLALFIIVAIIFGFWRRHIKQEKLEISEKVEAIFVRSYIVNNTGRMNVFKFQIDSSWYETEIYGNYGNLETGDTVLIKYALKDPSVTKMIDPNYK